MNTSPSPELTGTEARTGFGLTEWLILVVAVLASALAMSPNVADPDLWGHVQYGRDVIESGEIAETTSYSYTANGYRWINHENFSEIVMAIVADTLGPIGLVIGKFLLSLLVIGLVAWWNLRRGIGVIATSILLLLLGANLGYHWSIRPQLASFVCFTLMIALLQFSFEGWRGNWHFRFPRKWFAASASDSPNELGYESWKLRCLWLVPIVLLVWTNSHGGFVAGLCVYCAYLGLRAIESLSRRGSRGWGLFRRMTLMIVVAITITFLNPYGPRLHLWLLESLGSPRPEISDWSTTELTSVIGMKLWALVGVTIVSLLLSKRRYDLTQILLLGLTLWQSLSHFRHVPFFAILAAFWLGPHLQSALARLKISVSDPANEKALTRWAVHSVLIVCIGLVGFRLSQRLSELPVNRDVFPVDAIAFMKEHELNGRIVVTYDWAQYLIAARCVNSEGRVAFDGRFRTCYPQEVVDMHFDFLYGETDLMKRHRSPQSGEINSSRVLNYGKPSLVLISRKGEKTEKHMFENTDDWVLLYQDGIAQVWGRKVVYDDPTSPSYLSLERRAVCDQVPQGYRRWPAL